ncbi:SDR family NAD(P)-dependent oxidoreductase [Novosphingobium sp. ZW T3_23]|uniref:SDR family NAD(P)-dependent oxidoreductase n=1 Tax=Novosphingobium sp. ZW T3_23 TaxID=3378084 RepID=UPI003853AE28
MIDFSGRVALVTGAGRGLGFAYASGLAARGATVIVQDSGTGSDGIGTDPAVAASAAGRIAADGGRAFAEAGPIATCADCHDLIERVVAEHGRLDVLIHNAGWVGYEAIEELDPDFHHRMMRLGVDTPLWLAQAAWPAMREARFGRILLTTSDRAIYPAYAQVGPASYAAAKMGAIGIANALAREGEPHGITVNAISPVAKTRMWGIEGEPDELHPEAVAPGALWLVSPDCTDSGWVLRAANGQFVATRAQEAERVEYPRNLAAQEAATVEDVADAWSRIAIAVPEPRVVPSKIAHAAFGGSAVLGESPIWSRTGELLWVDTDGRTLNRFDPLTRRNAAFGMPDVIGMVAEREDGTLIAAIGCDLATVSATGEVRRFASAPRGSSAYRLNDGKLDARGRLWIGLMHNDLEGGTGLLYRYDPDGSWHVMDNGFTLINGLDWSPDRRTLYVTDSRIPVIYAYDHDPLTGAIGNRRDFATFNPDDGFPDGLLVDEDGLIWSTFFDGGAIRRIAPDGTSMGKIDLPVSRPTSCCFSPDRKLLYVTTARLGLTDARLKQEPLAGALLTIRLDAAR